MNPKQQIGAAGSESGAGPEARRSRRRASATMAPSRDDPARPRWQAQSQREGKQGSPLALTSASPGHSQVRPWAGHDPGQLLLYSQAHWLHETTRNDQPRLCCM
jgi:hypothetical protein